MGGWAGDGGWGVRREGDGLLADDAGGLPLVGDSSASKGAAFKMQPSLLSAPFSCWIDKRDAGDPR